MSEDVEMAGCIIVVIVQLVIGLGSTLSDVQLNMWGYQSAFSVSDTLLILSDEMALVTMSLNKVTASQNA